MLEEDPDHGGIFLNLASTSHIIDLFPMGSGGTKPAKDGSPLMHIAFKVSSYHALREAHDTLIEHGAAIRALRNHVSQRSIYFSDPEGTPLEIYYEKNPIGRTSPRMATATMTAHFPSTRWRPAGNSMEAIYIFMRRDLKIRRGKEITQAGHAVLGLAAKDRPIITLKANSEEDLLALEARAREEGQSHCLLRDDGHTEVLEGTPTCIAILGGDYPDWRR